MIKRKKIIRCEVCKDPLRYLHANQFMCIQSSNMCKNSLKVIIIQIEEEE